MKKGRSEVRKEKIEAVNSLAKAITDSPVVCLIDLHKFPAKAMQKIRKEMKNSIYVKKKSILVRALEKDKKELLQHMSTSPALLLTSMDPFKLQKFLDKNKLKVPAKGGDVAPYDIEVKAGPTDLMPGPAITTLSKVGLQAKVEGGKIAVAKDKVVVKKGGAISAELASVMQMLKIAPMEVKMSISAAWEKGVIYTKDALSIDEEKVMADIVSAYHHALNLAINAVIPVRGTIDMLLTKAQMQAKALDAELQAKQPQQTEQKQEEAKQ